MDEQIKERLTRRSVWLRALYMVFFAIVYGVVELVWVVVVVVQFLLVLFTGRVNWRLLQFGNNLSAYFYALLRFQTFNTEVRPFPFADWPNETVEDDNPWTGAPLSAQAPASAEAGAEQPEDADAQGSGSPNPSRPPSARGEQPEDAEKRPDR